MTAQRITLDYSALDPAFWQGEKPKLDNISGAAWTGAHLWTASDEGATIERLERVGDGFSAARQYRLADYFDWLDPDRPEREADVEALAWDGERLWICGSHAIKRTQLGGVPDEVKAPRTLLGFLTLNKHGEPQSGVSLPRKEKTGSLLWAVEEDKGPLNAAIFEKQDWLDIEGFAVKGRYALVGLRRPLIEGRAVIIRIELKIGDELAIKEQDWGWAPMKTLDLGGLGVRDLLAAGEDALIIAGPQVTANGPYALYLWRTAFAGGAQARKLMDLPGDDTVKPEAMTLIDGRLLVINDGPQQDPARPGVISAYVYELTM
ncbi:MAG: DUF3616 domain-containing protein [Hyphomicrobiales bacterium]|nr:DUF3616 domain-containing protein [Hyphomicrobiales bacterium]